MATARKLPSGNWRALVYIGKDDETGKRKYESFTAPTRKQAERDAAVFAAGRTRRAQRITLRKAIDEYIETCTVTGLSPSTIAFYRSLQRSTFQSIMDRPVDTLTLRDIQLEVNRYAADHSPKTVKNAFFLLHTVLRKCAPSLALDDVMLPRAQLHEMTIPDDDQVRELLSSAKRTNIDLYLAILFAATMGLRRSEICALDWSDIDEQTHILTIDKAVVKDEHGVFVLKGTKSRAGTRRLFIADAAYSEIMSRKSTGRIVRMTPDQITREYAVLRDTLNVPGRFHDLRHYMASVMAALGVPENYAVEIMGHATHDMLQKVYQHTMEKKRAVVSSQISAHTSALLDGTDYDYATRNATQQGKNQTIASVLQ